MVGVRNLEGFSALPANHPLAELDIGNPFKWATFYDDFLAYEIAQAAGNPYTFTQTNGTDTIVGPTGVLTLTLGGADNDLAQIQLTEAPFQTNSKRMFFQTRVKFTAASGGTFAGNEFYFGLASEQTGANFFAADGSSMTMDDAIGFYKLDAGTSLGTVMGENDSRSTDSGLGLAMTSGEWLTLSFVYDGTAATFYVSHNADGSQAIEYSTIAGNDATSVLTPTLYIKAGEAKANVLSCDYIYVAAER